MASNSSGPSSPLNVAEAEQLAAQFRPVWDVDDATPSNEPAAAAAPVVEAPTAEAPEAVASPPVPKPTMRWAPGSGPQGFPAPAPPGPLPAPAPRNKVRAEAPTPELRELSGDEGQVSSDGAVAMAVVSAPVMPPKASDISVREEPSIVVRDVAATARAISEEDNEARRRQTVRIDELRHDPSVAAMYAKYEAESKAEDEARAAKAASRSASRPASAPLPEVEDGYTVPTNKNRTIVMGAVGAAALIVVLGIAKTALSPKEDAPTSTPTATATATATTTAAAVDTSTQGTSATGTPLPAATTTAEPPKTAATTAPTAPTGKTAVPAQVAPENPSTSPVAKNPTKTATTAAQTTPPPAGEKKKPAGKGNGTIVREVPFLARI